MPGKSPEKVEKKSVKDAKPLTKVLTEREYGKKINKIEAAAKALKSHVDRKSDEIQTLVEELVPAMNIDGDFKKGGKVKKDGVYRLHKGEKVVPVKKKK